MILRTASFLCVLYPNATADKECKESDWVFFTGLCHKSFVRAPQEKENWAATHCTLTHKGKRDKDWCDSRQNWRDLCHCRVIIRLQGRAQLGEPQTEAVACFPSRIGGRFVVRVFTTGCCGAPRRKTTMSTSRGASVEVGALHRE